MARISGIVILGFLVLCGIVMIGMAVYEVIFLTMPPNDYVMRYELILFCMIGILLVIPSMIGCRHLIKNKD